MAAAVGDAGDAPGAPRLSYAVLKKGNNSRPVKRALARRPQWSDMLDDGTNGGVTAELPALETGPAASASCGDRCAFKTDNMIWSGKVWDSNVSAALLSCGVVAWRWYRSCLMRSTRR